MFLPLECGGFVFGLCFIIHCIVSFLVLQSSVREIESLLLYFICLPDVLGLQCVIVVFPDYTHLIFYTGLASL